MVQELNNVLVASECSVDFILRVEPGGKNSGVVISKEKSLTTDEGQRTKSKKK